MPKKLLLVANMPSANTRYLAQRVLAGVRNPELDDVEGELLSPFDATPEQVLTCDAIILGTTENLGYMSGALKDFFDRIYYPCLERKQGLPCALYIRAGHDGTGTQRAVETIVTGLRWRWVQPPTILRGEFHETFGDRCEELGLTIAAALDAGII